MTMKYVLALVLVAPFMTVSSMAQDASHLDQHVYQGGPKTGVLHATRQVTAAASQAFAMAPVRMSHHYSGGPKTVVPHHSN
jgi:hypothetical protein